jgi:hypothetical protein
MAGAMGGATMAVATGYILDRTGGNYMLIFFTVGPAYMVALGIIHLLVPSLQQMDESELVAPKPLSVGSFMGFGFVGLILGSFGGWCLGLMSQQSGQSLLKYMGAGALIGIVGGIVIGNIFSKMRRR